MALLWLFANEEGVWHASSGWLLDLAEGSLLPPYSDTPFWLSELHAGCVSMGSGEGAWRGVGLKHPGEVLVPITLTPASRQWLRGGAQATLWEKGNVLQRGWVSSGKRRAFVAHVSDARKAECDHQISDAQESIGRGAV